MEFSDETRLFLKKYIDQICPTGGGGVVKDFPSKNAFKLKRNMENSKGCRYDSIKSMGLC